MFFIQRPRPRPRLGRMEIEMVESEVTSVILSNSEYAIMSGKSMSIRIKHGLEAPNSEGGIEGPYQQSSEQDSVASLENDDAKDFRARLDLVVTNKQVRIKPVHRVNHSPCSYLSQHRANIPLGKWLFLFQSVLFCIFPILKLVSQGSIALAILLFRKLLLSTTLVS